MSECRTEGLPDVLDVAIDNMIAVEDWLADVVADIGEHLHDDDERRLQLLYGCLKAQHSLRDARDVVSAGRAAP